MNKRRSIAEQYLEFMGSWMAGALVGHYLGKLIAFILLVWLIGKCICT